MVVVKGGTTPCKKGAAIVREGRISGGLYESTSTSTIIDITKYNHSINEQNII